MFDNNGLALRPKNHLAPMIPLCLEALQRMYLPDQALFCMCEELVDSRLVIRGTSLRYTAIALIGLAAAQKYGGYIPRVLDLHKIAERISLEADEPIGDLGLFVWALSTVSPKAALLKSAQLFDRLRQSPKLLRSLDSEQLAWILVGLCSIYRLNRSIQFKELAFDVARVLTGAHDSATGLFSRYTNGQRSILRNMVTFAGQIYPIYALATFIETFGTGAWLKPAQDCVDRICHLQLPDGGWPWMYSANKGIVVEPYPVFCVHQDGMAPMAINKLDRVSNSDHSKEVIRGIRWMFMQNALGISMVDEEKKVIWRALQPSRIFGLKTTVILNVGSSLLFGKSMVGRGKLHLIAQCRPYHLGWLLLAAFE